MDEHVVKFYVVACCHYYCFCTHFGLLKYFVREGAYTLPLLLLWMHWHVFHWDVDEKLWWGSQVCRLHSSSLQLQVFSSWQWASCQTERELSRHHNVVVNLIPLCSHIILTDWSHTYCSQSSTFLLPVPSTPKLTDCVHGRIPRLPQVLQPPSW